MALTQISTAGVKDDAVTSGKIPADAVGSSEIAANAVGTSEIADEAVTLAKLPHGTSSNDGKFLRANNGADPSFETVSIPAGTTINNNADNRIITGSGTANTLNGESGLTYDSGGMSITGDSDRDGIKITQANNYYGEFMFNSNRSSANNALGIIRSEWNSTEVASIYLTAGSDTTNKDDGQIKFMTSPDSGTGIQTRMTIDANGRIGILNPNLDNFDSSADDLVINGSGNTGITINSGAASSTSEGNLVFAEGNGTGGSADGFRGAIQYKHGDDRMVFYTNNGERLRILAGGGLTFNGDTAAANALDDYEEGTYTPTLTGSSSTTSFTLYSNEDTLSYVKIGNNCWISGRIRINNDQYSGYVRVTLPFTSAQGTDCSNCGMSAVATHGVTFSDSIDKGLFFETWSNTAMGVFVFQREDTGWTNGTNAHITANNYITFNHHYITQ